MPWYCPAIEASKENFDDRKLSFLSVRKPFVEGVVTRVCFLLKVRAEKLEEYRRRHQEVWPEMLDALRTTGWSNYSLFLRHDGLLVGYLETPDFEQARLRMQDHPVNARWQAEMAPFFELPGNGTADASMMPLEEVFHLD
jgi:L-rhamnose mutarotase